MIKSIRFLLIAILLSPFLFLIIHFPDLRIDDYSEFLWATKNTFLQATGSAFFSLIFGIWGALGLIHFSAPKYKLIRSVLEIICLAPNFLPTIFILLSLLSILEPYPIGLTGIIFIHSIINFGLVAVLLAGIIEKKIGKFSELALVEGASRVSFMKKVFFPLLKADLIKLFFYVFAVCFTSFSIPLIIGGGKGTTIEVLIYENIRLNSNWGSAVALALLQSILILFLSYFIKIGQTQTSNQSSQFSLIQSVTGFLMILFVGIILTVGYLEGVILGIGKVASLYGLQTEIIYNFFGSFMVALFLGILVYLFLIATSYVWKLDWFSKVIDGLLPPTTALTGFTFLILGSNEGVWPYIKIPVGLLLIIFPTVYRMGWSHFLNSFQRQNEVATILGSSNAETFRYILLPQISSRAGLLSGIAAIWAAGDFAMSRILGHKDITLGMMVDNLITTYRVDLGSFLSLGILLVSALVFITMIGVGYVISRKSSYKIL